VKQSRSPKCRQRKKQWLANLQQKSEIFSQENDALSAQVSQLRDEVLNLKTKLIAHKDCEVTRERWPSGLGQMRGIGEGMALRDSLSMRQPEHGDTLDDPG